MSGPAVRRGLILGALLLATQPAAAGEDLARLLPADTEYFISIDLQQVLQSPLYKKYLTGPIEAEMKRKENKEYFRASGLDPLRDLGRLVVVSDPGHSPERLMLVATGNFDPKKLTVLLEESSKKEKATVSVERVDGLSLLKLEAQRPDKKTVTFYALIQPVSSGATARVLLAAPRPAPRGA
jgi:hypothetical protein